MAEGSFHDHSMAFAAAAFQKMNALRHSATPHNYEIWYNYASAANQSLNQAINDLMQTRGVMTQADLDELYERFFSSSRIVEQLDSFGAQVIGEIGQIVSFIDGTLDSASRHSENLADVNAEIDTVIEPNGLRAIVGRLIRTAKDIESTNQQLEAHLQDSRQEINQLQKHLSAVRNEIITDPLTKLGNRKHFDQSIVKAIHDARANEAPLALVMIDIDDFKKFNDTYGHLIGDQVLRLVSKSVKLHVKEQDLAARYGGEEFAVILRNTSPRQAATLADLIRRAVMGRELVKRSTGENLGHVTVSLGLAMRREGDTAQTLIERADKCLYAAKRGGRNRMVCDSDPEYVASQAKVA
jgi:diguanylate cyclase